MNTYNKLCPSCQGEILYKYKKNLENSIKNNIICRKCQSKIANLKQKKDFQKKCPTCDKNINYNNFSSYKISLEKKSECKSCSKTGSKNVMFGRTGSLNPMHGKHHTQQTKKLLSEQKKGAVMKKETKEKISLHMKVKNPMSGKSLFSVWVEKYGKDIAKEKMENYKLKQSQANSGSQNGMFGKPPPQKSGNGFSGWFNNFYFRSLRELMFLIYAKNNNLKIVSAENKLCRILYLNCIGETRTYMGDFIVDDTFFIEIKPEKLWNTPNNLAKFKEAKKFCLENNLTFQLLDPPIDFDLIYNLYLSNDVTFTEKSKERFLKYKDLIHSN
jgi:hypothetical protein